MISENLPRRQGLPPTPGRLSADLEAEARELGAGSWEAEETRMLNHWATGLRSGLLPGIVELQHQKSPKKEVNNLKVCKEVLIFGYVG